MLAYVLAVVLSGAIGTLASAAKTPRSRIVLTIIAILPYCIVAGVRSESIGTDVLVYAKPLFNTAQSYGLIAYMSSSIVGDMEPLLPIVVWLVTRIFNDFVAVLFVVQLLAVAPLAYALSRIAPKHLGLGLAVYGLLFFPLTLNIMRQFIAAGILVAALSLLFEGRWREALVVVLVSFGFHNTGLMGFAIFPIVGIVRRQKTAVSTVRRKKSAEALYAVLAISLIAYIILLAFGKNWLPLLALIKKSYSAQANYASGGPTEGVLLVFVVLAGVYVVFVGGHGRLQKSTELTSLLIVVGLGAALCQLSLLASQMGRVGYYFMMAVPLLAARLIMETPPHSSGRTAAYLMVFAVCVFYFMWCYASGTNADLVPYSSNVLLFLGAA